MSTPTTPDVAGAGRFVTAHARILDRRRFAVITAGTDQSGLVAALAPYSNPDGGYGWGLEPDLRDRTSQPVGAMHAFETLADAASSAPTDADRSSIRSRARSLLEWLGAVSLADGGVPFALPIGDPTGCAPFWVDADPASTSLQITAAVLGEALRLAEVEPEVGRHPWIAGATRCCLDAIRALDDRPHALIVSYAMKVLDRLASVDTEAGALLDHLGRLIPDDGILRVDGGLADEAIRPLDLSPTVDGAARRFFGTDVISAELDRLAGQQQADGGWPLEWAASSPAAELEWRGWLTVRAVSLLHQHGRIDDAPSLAG